ncbi:MAG: hypothetical protein ACI4O0_09520 [Candidatus Limivicinus sp.]
MNANAIVYTSNTGYTAQYAALLGKKTGLPVYSLPQAEEKLPGENCIIYLGWLMAGRVQGFARAAKRYRIAVVCGVGMGATGSQLADVRKSNKLGDDLPLFTLQGGFDMGRLKGVYKLMMQVMAKTVGKTLAAKQDRTAEEEQMLCLLTQGGSCVSEENLQPVLDWFFER